MNDILKKINKFNKRWGIVDDSTCEEEFKKFKTRVLNIFSDIDSHVTEEGISTFCQLLGCREFSYFLNFNTNIGSSYNMDRSYSGSSNNNALVVYRLKTPIIHKEMTKHFVKI